MPENKARVFSPLSLTGYLNFFILLFKLCAPLQLAVNEIINYKSVGISLRSSSVNIRIVIRRVVYQFRTSHIYFTSTANEWVFIYIRHNSARIEYYYSLYL